jgi:hypothetical protein
MAEREPALPADHPLTVAQAFAAMRLFLQRFHKRGDLGADALPSILSWTSLRVWKQAGPYPLTADPAQWFDWIDAVQGALEGADADDAGTDAELRRG